MLAFVYFTVKMHVYFILIFGVILNVNVLLVE